MFPLKAALSINDITSDLVDPPTILMVESGGHLGSALPFPPSFKATQREAYPEISTRHYKTTKMSALKAVEEILEKFPRTRILRKEAGDEVYLQAEFSTRLLRFKDDVAVRIREAEGVSTIDIRSRSRIGQGDLGTNANRIRGLYARINRKLAQVGDAGSHDKN